jgi:hypothetical protein
MLNNTNSSSRRYSIDSTDEPMGRASPNNSSVEHYCRIVFVVLLMLVAIGSATFLVVLVLTDEQKERELQKKREGWRQKWEIIKPIIDKLPLGFFLNFLRNLIILAIDRQANI